MCVRKSLRLSEKKCINYRDKRPYRRREECYIEIKERVKMRYCEKCNTIMITEYCKCRNRLYDTSDFSDGGESFQTADWTIASSSG